MFSFKRITHDESQTNRTFQGQKICLNPFPQQFSPTITTLESNNWVPNLGRGVLFLPFGLPCPTQSFCPSPTPTGRPIRREIWTNRRGSGPPPTPPRLAQWSCDSLSSRRATRAARDETLDMGLPLFGWVPVFFGGWKGKPNGHHLFGEYAKKKNRHGKMWKWHLESVPLFEDCRYGQRENSDLVCYCWILLFGGTPRTPLHKFRQVLLHSLTRTHHPPFM